MHNHRCLLNPPGWKPRNIRHRWIPVDSARAAARRFVNSRSRRLAEASTATTVLTTTPVEYDEHRRTSQQEKSCKIRQLRTLANADELAVPGSTLPHHMP